MGMDIEGVLTTCTTVRIGLNVVTVTKGPLAHHGSLAPVVREMPTSEGPEEPLVHGVAVLGLMSLVGPLGVARADMGPGRKLARSLMNICAV